MLIIQDKIRFVKGFFLDFRDFCLSARRGGHTPGRMMLWEALWMDTRAYRIWKEAVIFYLGGLLYCGLELLWRQWTHGSMFVLGGLCFWLVGRLGRRLPVLVRMALGAVLVSFLEFWTGVLVNRVLDLGVWDYSATPLNLLGQVCLPYTLLWFPVCGFAILAENGLRHALFREPMPQYRWIV